MFLQEMQSPECEGVVTWKTRTRQGEVFSQVIYYTLEIIAPMKYSFKTLGGFYFDGKEWQDLVCMTYVPMYIPLNNINASVAFGKIPEGVACSE